jgi:aminoglycoside 6'-N-acetyltransferase I
MASLRHDYVNGTKSSPVAFPGGLYFAPETRGGGVARLNRGCTHLASDADIANDGSQRLHRALGFEDTERVVYFRRILDATRAADRALR